MKGVIVLCSDLGLSKYRKCRILPIGAVCVSRDILAWQVLFCFIRIWKPHFTKNKETARYVVCYYATKPDGCKNFENF